ncbi:MAG TPA: DUF554 family protein [Candidatus Baltobacteraceae bacterium]|jgi:hypothetical protein|nr:DUF554 family protein [Candidatus Baltobacteraceae bacterium]
MTGAMVNAAGIVVGGIWALIARRPIPAIYQQGLKIVLGVYTMWFGLKLTWGSINGSVGQAAKELCIVLLAMALGKMTGRLMRLQKLSNSVGQYASSVLAAPTAKKRFSNGFVMATALFCAGPLAVLASVQEGLNGFSPVFLVKAATDGLATYAFCATFGWGAMASAIPVLALEGALIRGMQLLEPLLRNRPWPLIDAVNAVDGLLIFCVAMIILELKKIQVADYYPSLVFAPLLAWWLW